MTKTFADFSKEIRGSSIGGSKTMSQVLVFPSTLLVVDYCLFGLGQSTLVMQSTQDVEKVVRCELINDGKEHREILELPEVGVYEVYISKEDCVLIQYNVTIHS